MNDYLPISLQKTRGSVLGMRSRDPQN